MSISPGELLDISGVGDPVTVAQHNFEIATRKLFKITPTWQDGVATDKIGPPTTGAHIEDEYWEDAWNGGWRCTSAGSPGTWRQESAAVRNGEPGIGTIPTGYQILDSADSYRRKYHYGSFVWRLVNAREAYSALTGLTGGGATNLDGIVTVGLALNTVAEMFITDALYRYILRPGTLNERSPFVIRPDDWDASTNAKVWMRIRLDEYPAGTIRAITSLHGFTGSSLDGIPTVTLAVGSIAQIVVSGALMVYRLRDGTDGTSSPMVIRPEDYAGGSPPSANKKVWERILYVKTGAILHLPASSGGVGDAAIKIDAGTLLAAPENGAMEFNGTNLFFTRAGSLREGVLTQSAVTTEAVASDTTVTVNIGGVTYKLLARA